MTEFRRSHSPRHDDTTLRCLATATAAASVAFCELQARLAALAEVLEATDDDEKGRKARAEYDHAILTARQSILALHELRSALSDRSSLISLHITDAEELLHALALFNDGCDLNSSHLAFARAILTAHGRTAHARNAALQQLTTIASAARIPPRAPPPRPHSDTFSAQTKASGTVTA